jgi:UDP-N-acetylmuramyl pentapeptide phosphotransferase/UDP-N-acetylglucosamine-1-phosphate transferase
MGLIIGIVVLTVGIAASLIFLTGIAVFVWDAIKTTLEERQHKKFYSDFDRRLWEEHCERKWGKL